MKDFKVYLFDVILAISEAIDLTSHKLANHHMEVATISYNLAKELNMSDEQIQLLMVASLIHDCGSVTYTVKQRLETLSFEFENTYLHAEDGYNLLKDFPPLQQTAKIIRYHHTNWFEGAGSEINGEKVPDLAHLVHLADRIAILFNKNKEPLSQVKEILNIIKPRSGMMFKPEYVKAFERIAVKESFWFDIMNSDYFIHDVKKRRFSDRMLDLEETMNFADVMRRLIDYRSPFTAIHSKGVSVVSALIASYAGFSTHDCMLMKLAGLIHDIGKLGVPVEILEKPGALNREEFNVIRSHTYYSHKILSNIEGFDLINEWASYHHEKLDGNGYPFHLTDKELSLGSRIMVVADIFVALAEDRPYRKGMNTEQIKNVFDNMADLGKVDVKIKDILFSNLEEINELRALAQKVSEEDYRCVNCAS